MSQKEKRMYFVFTFKCKQLQNEFFLSVKSTGHNSSLLLNKKMEDLEQCFHFIRDLCVKWIDGTYTDHV